jgi:hypothetical protein
VDAGWTGSLLSWFNRFNRFSYAQLLDKFAFQSNVPSSKKKKKKAFFEMYTRAAVLLHRQRSPEELQQLIAWYKIRDTFFGQNNARPLPCFNEALKLASVCGHPHAVWLTKLFGGRDVDSCEEVRQVFLGCENDSRELCFAGVLEGGIINEIRRAADRGDAVAHAEMAKETGVKSVFDGLQNLLPKVNVMGSTGLVFVTNMEVDANKMRKKQS